MPAQGKVLLIRLHFIYDVTYFSSTIHTSSLYGAIWGLGHGIASFFLGLAVSTTISYVNDVVTITMKDKNLFSYFSQPIVNMIYCEECYKSIVDFIMGLTLLIVGIMSIRESCISNPHTPQENSLSKPNYKIRYFLTFLNGSVMGLSLDGIPSLTPAAFMGGSSGLYDDSTSAILFLLAYAVATVVSMAVLCAIFGEATCWLYRIVQSRRRVVVVKSQEKGENGVPASIETDDEHEADNDNASLINKLTYNSSLISIFFGVLWMLAAAMKSAMTGTFEVHNDNYIRQISRLDSICSAALSGGCVASLVVSTIGTVLSELDWEPTATTFPLSHLQFLRALSFRSFRGMYLHKPQAHTV